MLTVKRAKAKQAVVEAAGGKGRAAAPVAPLPLDTSSRVVYVGNLPWEVDEEVLAATFEVRLCISYSPNSSELTLLHRRRGCPLRA